MRERNFQISLVRNHYWQLLRENKTVDVSPSPFFGSDVLVLELLDSVFDLVNACGRRTHRKGVQGGAGTKRMVLEFLNGGVTFR